MKKFAIVDVNRENAVSTIFKSPEFMEVAGAAGRAEVTFQTQTGEKIVVRLAPRLLSKTNKGIPMFP